MTRRASLVIAMLAAASPLLFADKLPPGGTVGNGEITIDVGSDQGPVTYRASGFFGNPPIEMLAPAKPKLLSWIQGYGGYSTAEAVGARYQVKLFNLGYLPTTVTGDWSGWESYVSGMARQAIGKPLVELDIWNEPEYPDYWPGGGGTSDPRYFELWKRAYRAIRAAYPNAVIAGPSSTQVGWTLNTFLPWAKSEGVFPDVVTWHELGNTGTYLEDHVTQVRAYLAANAPNSKISINEWLPSAYATSAAVPVKFFYLLEKSRVDSSARACWQENGVWPCSSQMNNLLTEAREPRSIWWTFKGYADVTGRLVSTTASDSVAVAGVDQGTRTISVIVGQLSTSETVLKFVNLDRAGFLGERVNVTAQHIPYSGTNALLSPLLTMNNEELSAAGGQLTLTLPNMQSNDAYIVKISAIDDPGGAPLVAGTDRVFALAGLCGIPAGVAALSVNLAVTQPTAQGSLRLYPAGIPVPTVSSINYSAGQTRANNAIVKPNASGELGVRCSQASGTAHFILDVNGYFDSGSFYSLTPCRAVDTRNQ